MGDIRDFYLKVQVKVYNVDKPTFIRNGKEESVRTKMIRKFSDLDDEIERKKPVEIYFYSAANVFEGKLVTCCDEYSDLSPIFIRYRFFKDETISFEYLN